MLDNLVESRSIAGEKRRFRGLFLATSVFMGLILIAGFVVNLFSQELVLGAEDLELSALVAPVVVPPEKPPVAEPAEKTSDERRTSSEENVPVRRFNVQRLEESPVRAPDRIPTATSDYRARPNSYFRLGQTDSDPVLSGTGSGRGGKAPDGASNGLRRQPEPDENSDQTTESEPPPVLKKPVSQAPKVVRTSSVVNGKAIRLVKPAYPTEAKNVGARGDVRIRVTIGEEGDVIQASVIEGHPLLRGPALRAARSSKFSPTLLGGEKVRVEGVIVYRFTD